MRVLVHRTRVTVLHRTRDMRTEWDEFSFTPSAKCWREIPETWGEVIRSASEPIAIDTPLLCRLAEIDLPATSEPPVVPNERTRLVTPFDKFGWNAGSVYQAARLESRGFRFAPETAPVPEPAVAPAPTENCPDPRCGHVKHGCPTCVWWGRKEEEASSPVPALVPVPTAASTRWGIAFTTGPLGRRSWLAKSSTEGGSIAGIRDMTKVAEWTDRADAEEWFRANGMQVDQLVSPGLDWVYPSIELIPEGETPCGCEFEINSRPSVLAQARLIQAELPPPNPRPTKRPRRQRTGQAVFAFAEVDL